MHRVSPLSNSLRIAACSVLLAACSGTGTLPDIRASDYNQSCRTASDCVLIDEGSSCCGACGNAAINKADLSKYQADAKPRMDACRETACPAIACAFAAPMCTAAGKCEVCRDQANCPTM